MDCTVFICFQPVQFLFRHGNILSFFIFVPFYDIPRGYFFPTMGTIFFVFYPRTAFFIQLIKMDIVIHGCFMKPYGY